MIDNKILYNNFNLLRLLAALQVVYTHSIAHLHIQNEIALLIKNVTSYFPGVPIFFLISGYLITMSYEKNSNLREYSINRLLRIFPGLYVSFFVGLIILWYFGEFDDVILVDVVPWIIAQLSIFQFYNPEFIRDFGVGVINGSLWTISVELCFYMILPFIYLYLKKDFKKRLAFLLLISFSFYYYIHEISANIAIYEKLIKVSILPYLFYFLFGLSIYKYRDKFMKYIENKMLWYLGFYCVVCIINLDLFIYGLIKQIVLSLFIFSFVFSYKNLSYKLLKHNDFTYGIYIYHMLIINILIELGIHGKIEYLVIVLIVSIFCGIISYFFIEKPFLGMKKRSLYRQIH